jgi:hypothetical protein
MLRNTAYEDLSELNSIYLLKVHHKTGDLL